MPENDKSPSILAQYVSERGIYGTPVSELAAIALDSSAMLARVVELLELLSEVPAIAQSPHGSGIREVLKPLKERSAAHVEAMKRLTLEESIGAHRG